MAEIDILITNGWVLDSDGIGRPADVAIRGDRIVAVGPIPSNVDAERVIDAKGRLISPGFIDIHTHSDVSAICNPSCESKVFQGVTTEVTGNCSLSAFPINPCHLDEHKALMQIVSLDDVDYDWTDLDGYARRVEAAAPVINLVPMVGHGALRIAAGFGRMAAPCESDDLSAMSRLLETAFDQGAFGFTTGLSYVPSGYADENEIVALTSLAERYDRLYATHVRADSTELDAFNEAAATTRRSNVRLQYSHLAINQPSLWGQADVVLGRFHALRAEGLDVAFDVYPYDASSSALSQYVPPWTIQGGFDAMRARLRDPAVRRQAIDDAKMSWWGGQEGPWRWDRFFISAAPAGAKDLMGRSMSDVATAENMSGEELAFRLLEEYGNDVHVVLHYREETDVVTFIKDDLAIIGSDGLALPVKNDGNQPHPRSFGSFPRVLARFVRDQKVVELADAIRKMTAAPAERLRLRDRGKLERNYHADVILIDSDKVTDRSTFAQPYALAEGVDTVIVNGSIVLDERKLTGARPGKLLRRSC